MSSGASLRFMTWNLNRRKKKGVKSTIEKCYVAFLQETHSYEDLKLEGWKSFYTTQTSNTAGVAILIKTDIFDESCCTVERDSDGCYIVVKCILKRQLFTLISLYNPPGTTTSIIKLSNVIERLADGIFVIGGDFNLALNPYLDRNSKTKCSAHLCLKPVVELFMTSFNLVDVWRRFHPMETHGFSYQSRKYSTKAIKSRLEYLFIPEESMLYIKTCEISEEVCGSNHQPVLFETRMIKAPEFYPNVTEEENKSLSFNNLDTNKWLSYISKLDSFENPHTPLIKKKEIVKAIESLSVNQKQLDRPDRIPLSYYVNNWNELTPILCAFYNNILQQPENIPESFNEAFEVSGTYRFNVVYLILATIMARRLHEHLESHSVDYTDDRNEENYKEVLFTFNTQEVIKWSVLEKFLKQEMDKDKTNPPLPNTYLNVYVKDFLKTSSEGILLCWGCPLTPVLKTLCLKCIADEMIKNIRDQRSKLFISRENVVARFYIDFDEQLLTNLKEKYTFMECKVLYDLRPVQFPRED